MATFTASAAQVEAMAFAVPNGTISRVITYSHPTALSIGDVVQMLKVPQGAIMSQVRAGGSVSAGVVSIVVGDGNDISAYTTLAAISAASLPVALNGRAGIGRSYSAEDTIDIQITALSAVPNTAKLYLLVSYVMVNSS